VNPGFWDGLPSDVRTVLDEAMRESTQYVNSIAQQVNAEARAAVAGSGRNTLIELGEHERSQWRAAMRPVWDLFAGDIGPQLLEAAAESRSR